MGCPMNSFVELDHRRADAIQRVLRRASRLGVADRHALFSDLTIVQQTSEEIGRQWPSGGPFARTSYKAREMGPFYSEPNPASSEVDR